MKKKLETILNAMCMGRLLNKAGCMTWVVVLSLIATHAYSQTVGNEWINFSQKYYKIPVTQQGIYRLTFLDLQQAGIPLSTVDPRKIQLFHRGTEQAIAVVGESDGSFQSADYIEFYGEGNDGTLDTELYRPAAAQPHPYYSLFSDTTYYFLTWRIDGGQGKRMAVVNESNTTSIPAETYHWEEKRLVLTDLYSEGMHYPTYRQASEAHHAYYNYGEGWTGNWIFYPNTADFTLSGLTQMVSAAPKPKLEVLINGASNERQNVDVLAGASVAGLRVVGNLKFDLNISRWLRTPLEHTDLAGGSVVVRVRPNDIAGVNIKVVSPGAIRLLYPQHWDMESKTQKLFALSDSLSAAQRYIEIANPAAGTVLYDISDKNTLRLITTQLTAGKLNATFPTAQKLFAQSGFLTISKPIKPVAFRAINPARGNYLIITHPMLRQSVNGQGDPIQAYANYRASVAGGSYDTLVVHADQLFDQFSYGEYTPLAIRRFVQWMYKNGKPEYLMMIGRGISAPFIRKTPERSLLQSSFFENDQQKIYDLVPPAGYPGSDLIYSDGLGGQPGVQALATGRLSASTPQQVWNYLLKVKEHEAVPPDANWRKSLLHMSGGRTSLELDRFYGFINSYKSIAQGSALGGSVEMISKKDFDNPTEYNKFINISSQLNGDGKMFVTLFGHSAPFVNDFDIGYASPVQYGFRNKGKYPFVMINGCQSGDVFGYSYSNAEDWTMGKSDRGSIAWIAHSSWGYDFYLHLYSTTFYQTAFGDSLFLGKSIGQIQKETAKRLLNLSQGDDITVIHANEVILQGDPAVVVVPFTKPDYAISESSLFLQTANNVPLTAALDSFQIGIVVSNYGKVSNKRFAVTVKRGFGDGSIVSLDTVYYNPVSYRDTLYFTIPNIDTKVGGNQRFEVFIDVNNEVDEYNENNNIAIRSFTIPSVGAIPLFPQEYSIVHTQPVRFIAQSTTPASETHTYTIELDTSATFTSAAKKTTTISSQLLISWETNLLNNTTAHDSTVYYWRISLADRPIGADNSWVESSFIYIRNSPDGWSQSQMPQFSKASLKSMVRNTSTSQWEFTRNTSVVGVKTYGADTQVEAYKQAEIMINNSVALFGGSCNYTWPGGYDPNRFVVMLFHQTNIQSYSLLPGNNCTRLPFFTHTLPDGYIRDNNGLTDLISRVPAGDYVLMFTTGITDFSNWSATTRQQLLDIGADPAKIAQLKTGDPYIILGQKGAAPGTAKEVYPDYADDVPPRKQSLTLLGTLSGKDDVGTITSSLIGPATLWGTLHHRIQSLEKPSFDKWQLDLIGVDLKGKETVVYPNIQTSPLPIDFINSKQYPYLRLRLQAKDTFNLTPPQLKKWQVIYDGVPEGLINTSLLPPDTYTVAVQQEGGKFSVPVIFQNISPRAFSDSLMVEYSLLNKTTRKVQKFNFKIRAPKANGDTTQFRVVVNIPFGANMGGENELQIVVNPQLLPEQNYANNLLTLPFVVDKDKLNPILDVTFDGQRIMDGEIISPSPLVVVNVKDENKLLVRQDTTGLELYVRRPGGSRFERVSLQDPNVRWTPAGADNQFRLEWQPRNLPDGIYTLEVRAEDVSGNKAGLEPYRISFEVVNQSTITHFYPYPNPFSTGTRFVFTLTGATVPEQIKIQIMTVSGKVVREITQDELGPIRIGNNISQYIWDGSDEFGDKLANGVYLYRVITHLNGQDIDRRATAADKAFKKEFGKLYILR